MMVTQKVSANEAMDALNRLEMVVQHVTRGHLSDDVALLERYIDQERLEHIDQEADGERCWACGVGAP